MINAFITKTYLYNFDPLKPHFYIVKLGSEGVFNIFLISAQEHRLWVLDKTVFLRRSYRVPNIYVLAEVRKISEIFIWKFSFLVVKFSIHLNRRVFVNAFSHLKFMMKEMTDFPRFYNVMNPASFVRSFFLSFSIRWCCFLVISSN